MHIISRTLIGYGPMRVLALRAIFLSILIPESEARFLRDAESMVGEKIAPACFLAPPFKVFPALPGAGKTIDSLALLMQHGVSHGIPSGHCNGTGDKCMRAT